MTSDIRTLSQLHGFPSKPTDLLLQTAERLEEACLNIVNQVAAGTQIDGVNAVTFHIRFGLLCKIADELHDRGVHFESALV